MSESSRNGEKRFFDVDTSFPGLNPVLGRPGGDPACHRSSPCSVSARFFRRESRRVATPAASAPSRRRCRRCRRWWNCRRRRTVDPPTRRPSRNFIKLFFNGHRWWGQGILRGEVSLYHWPPVWMVLESSVWRLLFFLFLFAKQTSPNHRSMYTDTSSFSIPWWGQISQPSPWQDFPAWEQCYTTFYGWKLLHFIINQCVCPWRAFLAQSRL